MTGRAARLKDDLKTPLRRCRPQFSGLGPRTHCWFRERPNTWSPSHELHPSSKENGASRDARRGSVGDEGGKYQGAELDVRISERQTSSLEQLFIHDPIDQQPGRFGDELGMDRPEEAGLHNLMDQFPASTG